jgi:hypothetical protein
MRGRKDLFQDVAAWRLQNAALRRPNADRSELAWFLAVTPNYFSLLRVRPALGRMVSEQDGRERLPVLVLNHHYWVSRFAADPAIVGQSVLLNGSAFTIIGVLGPEFDGTEHLLLPIGFHFCPPRPKGISIPHFATTRPGATSVAIRPSAEFSPASTWRR